MNYKKYLITIIILISSNFASGQVVLSTEQARAVLKDLEHRKFLIEQVSILKADTSSYIKIIHNKDLVIETMKSVQDDMYLKLSDSYKQEKDLKLDFEKRQKRSRSVIYTLGGIAGVLFAIILIK